MTIMRDVQLLKADLTGERATYKIQDFTSDPVLFGFCQLPQVFELKQKAIVNFADHHDRLRPDWRHSGPHGHAHDADQQAAGYG